MVDLNKCKIGDTLISCHGEKLIYYKVEERGAPFRHRVLYSNGSGGSRSDDGRAFINRPLPSDHNIVEIRPLDRSGKHDAEIVNVSDLEDEYVVNFSKNWAIQFHDGTVMEFDTENEAYEAQLIHRETVGI